MKKTDLHSQYTNQSATIFTSAAIGLTVSSALVFLTSSVSNLNTVAGVIFQVVSIGFMIFAYVSRIRLEK